ncbi:MAG: M15 family metallopeptidase [Acidobacteriota bacterium]
MTNKGNLLRVGGGQNSRPNLLAVLAFCIFSILLASRGSDGALAQEPPKEAGSFRPSELVDLEGLDPTIHLEIRYATANNLMGKPVYSEARAFLQKPAAMALLRAHRMLRKDGYGLLIFDGYRPWSVTKLFWDATPVDKKVFVADPSKGSRHNRGCAVDLTLYDFKTGKEVEMTGAYDEMTERSYANYQGGTPEQRRRRDLLRKAMEAEGYSVYPEEWWHFDYKDWQKYPILNLSFAELNKPRVKRAAQ